ncbi:MAG: hypothetical protein IJK58_04670 [Clostridia bacterium]|nr:hypothetical protein [Clostridia bacterium]
MKRIALFLAALTVAAALAVGVSADVWYIEPEPDVMMVGKDGIDVFSYTGEEGDIHVDAEFGTVVQISGADYDEDPPAWELMIKLPDRDVIGRISSEEYNKLLSSTTEITPEYGIGEKVPAVTSTVTGGDAKFRYGPDNNFAYSYRFIPMWTVIKYEYVYNGWAYTQYEGEGGWVSLDWLEEGVHTAPPDPDPIPDPVPDPIPDPVPDPVPDPDPVPAPDPIPETTAEPVTESVETKEETGTAAPVQTETDPTQTSGPASETEKTDKPEKRSGLPSVAKTTIYCVIAAVIVSAVTLVIILIVVKKGRKQADGGDGNEDGDDGNADA